MWAQQPGNDVGRAVALRAAQSRLAEELTSLVHGPHQAAQVGRHARPLARSWPGQQWAGRSMDGAPDEMPRSRRGPDGSPSHGHASRLGVPRGVSSGDLPPRSEPDAVRGTAPAASARRIPRRFGIPRRTSRCSPNRRNRPRCATVSGRDDGVIIVAIVLVVAATVILARRPRQRGRGATSAAPNPKTTAKEGGDCCVDDAGKYSNAGRVTAGIGRRLW